ncbi:hypothetical protein [Pseudomonas sp. GV071]|uniref:hypothetical protein n=1 Tax=Pseudomonas sp. GV071 TaxID=2135754 RepID=UPI000D37DEC2|nr:hypothetical protein [Pseudomonas sp. GV071]PTQ70350.1 hypothetical protein C8K61_10672 [Pseudomonas sp. GV071]
MPDVIFGGLPIVLHAGPPAQSDASVLGEGLVRLGLGGGVKMTHFFKAGGSISGSGWMPPGLDGLDYSQPLELRLTSQECVVGDGLVYPLTSTPRDDVEPWAQALINGEWETAECTVAAGVVTVVAMPGATIYMVQWLPMYTVFASKPQKSMDPSTSVFTWQIDWQEV